MNALWPELAPIWVYLSGSPLAFLLLTLVAYQTGLWLYQRAGSHPLVNPVAIALAIVIGVLLLFNVPYKDYFEGAKFIHFLLGTATVSLAVPVYRTLPLLVSRWLPMLIALLAGGLVSVMVGLALGHLMALPPELLDPLWAKSVTTPIAMGIADQGGFSPTLAAVYAVSTGILGAVLGRYVFDALRVSPLWERGFAMGVGAHGIGTSRAFTVDAQAGAFATIGMGLHGIVGALLVPVIRGLLAQA
jgi:predicted murein hydrolase (TIGR00659 family)